SYIDCKYFILSVALFISCVPIRFDIYSTTINECGCALSLGPVKSIIPSILFEYGSTIGAAEQIQGCTPSQKCSYETIWIGYFDAIDVHIEIESDTFLLQIATYVKYNICYISILFHIHF